MLTLCEPPWVMLAAAAALGRSSLQPRRWPYLDEDASDNQTRDIHLEL